MEGLIGERLLFKSDYVFTRDVLSVEFILLYFSAHWCGPCRNFTPKLVSFYTAVNTATPKLVEVVFISSDQDQATFDAYYSTMPWLAVDYTEKGLRERLGNELNVTCIPKLVLLSPTGKLISDMCRGDVERLDTNVIEEWRTALRESL
jgi:nucleoredoxin